MTIANPSMFNSKDIPKPRNFSRGNSINLGGLGKKKNQLAAIKVEKSVPIAPSVRKSLKVNTFALPKKISLYGRRFIHKNNNL